MTSTLFVASAAAPSVQSSMILKLTFKPFLPKIESGCVSSPPFATRPPTHPTHTFPRTRTSASLLEEDAGISSGLEASRLLDLQPLDGLLPPGTHLPRSITPYRCRL